MQRYDYNYLQKVCQEESLELLKDYKNEKVIRSTNITFKCRHNDCNEICCKTFSALVKNKIVTCDKHTQTSKHNYDFLLNLFNKNNSILLENYHSKKLTRKFSIKFKCNYMDCNEKCYKTFGSLIDSEIFCCKIHTNIIKLEKMEKTSLDRYDSKNPMSNSEIKEKVRNTYIKNNNEEKRKISQEKRKTTCLEKYGVDHQSKSKEVREKIEKTNILRHGFPNPTLNSVVREKQRQTCFRNLGVYCPFSNQEIRNKINNDCLLHLFTFKTPIFIIIKKYKKTTLLVNRLWFS